MLLYTILFTPWDNILTISRVSR